MDLLKVILTSLLSLGALFIIGKIMGHKQLAQLDFFDYICGITIGSIAAELATELEEPLKPLIAMLIYGGVSVALSILSNKLPGARRFINGTPTIIMDKGKLYRENMKKAKLDLSEFMMMCRQAGYFDLGAVETAVYECNGQLTILPAAGQRPVAPEDIGLKVPKASVFTEIIMDGKVLYDNLKRMGLDEVWLKKQLNEQGYKEREVFLALCDDNNVLTVYPEADNKS